MTKHISRRTALTGAAWTAPVVVVASAAPAYAASGLDPTVVVTVERLIPGPDVCQYNYTFNNLGDPTTAFNHTDAFTRIMSVGRVEVATPDTGWTVTGGDGDAMQTFTVVKDDGVLPSGVTTHTVTYTATALSQPNTPLTGYTASLLITANPTPGIGSTTMSGFEDYFAIL